MPFTNPITTQKDFKTFGQGKTYIICFMSDECPHCMPHIKTVKEASKHTTTPVTFLDMTRNWHHKVFDNVVTTLSLQPNVPLLVKRDGGHFYTFNNDWANLGDFFGFEPDTPGVLNWRQHYHPLDTRFHMVVEQTLRLTCKQQHMLALYTHCPL